MALPKDSLIRSRNDAAQFPAIIFGKSTASILFFTMKFFVSKGTVARVPISTRELGSTDLQDLLQNHVESLLRLRDESEVHDIDLLTCNRRASRLPDVEVAAGIQSLQQKMRVLIEQVAHQIEDKNYVSSEQAIREMEISKLEQANATNLIEADKSLKTSCTSLKVTVQMFCEMNRWIVGRLSDRDGLPAEQERKLVLSNAILVYELAEFCVRFIETFQTSGVTEIRDLHKRMLDVIAELKREGHALRKKTGAREIDEPLRKKILQDVGIRELAVNELQKAWADYLEDAGLLEGQVKSFARKLPGLRLIRDNAKAQISTLSAVSVLQLVRNNIEAVDSAIFELETLELAALSPERVRRLLHF